MKLIYSTKDLNVDGFEYPNTPILVSNELEIVQPFLYFILYISIQYGRILSKNTIKNYSLVLYDYFSFLEANSIKWDAPYSKGKNDFSISIIAIYRNWSRNITDINGSRLVSDTTINMRLSIIKKFYEYCYKEKLINFKPWEIIIKFQPEEGISFLRHVRGKKQIESNDLTIKAFKKPPKVITLEEAKILINSISHKTLKLITKIILSTGIRKDELISLARDIIINPDMTNSNKRIPICLNPNQSCQRTKGSKSRTIFISVILMKEIWDYINFGEGVIRSKKYEKKYGSKPQHVFLNKNGDPFISSTLNNAYRKLYQGDNKKIGFVVSPHILRHTFATIELYAESKRTDTAKALLWVKERLGHSSITTTSVYLHCLESLVEQELNIYQEEIDNMV